MAMFGPAISAFAQSGLASSNPSPTPASPNRGTPPTPHNPRQNSLPHESSGPQPINAALGTNLPVGYGVGANLKLSPSDSNSYTETVMVGDSNNKSNLASGSNISYNCPSGLQPQGSFRSSDSGVSWATNNPPQPSGTTGSDPAVAFDASSTLYFAYLGKDCSTPPNVSMYISSSFNNGAWQGPTAVETSNGPDREMIAVDTTVNSGSHHNRIYLGYNLNTVGGAFQPLYVAYSDNQTSWTKTNVWNGALSNTAAYPAIGPNGEVYVAWNDYGDSSGGQDVLMKSTDGGNSYQALGSNPVVVGNNHIGFGVPLNKWSSSGRPVGPSPQIAVDRSSGQQSSHTGNVYMVWADKPGSYMHIFFARSTNGGQSWSTPVQVDTGNPYDAWSPSIAVDQSNGEVSLAWYDRRDDTTSPNEYYRVYYRQSADGGTTFTSPIAVSSAQGDPFIDANGTGDYMQMVAVNGTAHPAWSDNRAGNMAVYTAPISIPSVAPTCVTRPVAGAHFHTLTVDGFGHVWAVGRNESGQLGNGSTNGYNANTTISEVLGPGSVGVLSNIVSVAGGIRQSLALDSSGHVWSWGDNTYGQLGNPSVLGNSTTPVEVVGVNRVGYLSGIVQVSAGDEFSMALKSDGTVYAWGRNTYGQLGDGSLSDSVAPFEVLGLNGFNFLTGISQISAGQYFSLALKSDGTVWAWGDNSVGEAGQGRTKSTHYTWPVEVLGPRNGSTYLSNVRNIAAGYLHALAIVSGGSGYAWGHNLNGELGNNSTTDSPIPVPISALSASGPLAAGDSFSVALTSYRGNLSGWGTNGDGEMGNANYGTNKLTPITIPGILNITYISAGGYHLVALLNDGTVWTWGYGQYGELGDGSAPIAVPYPSPSLFPAALQPVTC
jgi:alpha-tubulin suppressor-like RCC1 family protein